MTHQSNNVESIASISPAEIQPPLPPKLPPSRRAKLSATLGYAQRAKALLLRDAKSTEEVILPQLLKFPQATEPKYQTRSPNSPIQLYRGKVAVEYGNCQVKSHALILLEWTPTVRLCAKLSWPGHGINLVGKKIRIRMGNGVNLDAWVNSQRAFGGIPHKLLANSVKRRHPIRVIVTGYAPYNPNGAKSLRFHVANLGQYRGSVIRGHGNKTWIGRAVLEARGWQILLDWLDLPDQMRERFQATGGFAITSAGVLRRKSNKLFSKQQADRFLEPVRWYLSFLSGRWVAPILRSAQSADGSLLWEDWTPYRTERRRDVQSWFNRLEREGISLAFKGFIRRIENRKWKSPFQLAIYWYLESNVCSGGLEGSLILIQAALELLAFEVLVNEKKLLSVNAFEKLKAADKIRQLLAVAKIPVKIRKSHQALRRFGRSHTCPDGPAVITVIRNSLIHSKPQKRAMLSRSKSNFLFDAWQLGLWYLELLLLWLSDYQGDYSDRCIRGAWQGEEVRRVPWAPK